MYGEVVEGGFPKVSVVIPCRDEAGTIEACIKSLIADDYPWDRLEILVVDGKSSDGTQQVVKQLAQEYPFVRLLDNPGRITPIGLNVGIRAASGDIIVIASAHARYGERYVSRSVAALRAGGAECVGGTMAAVPSGSGMIAEAIAVALSHRFGVGNSKYRISSRPGYVDTVAYGAYRSEVFRRIGLFDERLVRNQDIELNARLRKAGGRIYMTPEMHSDYYCRSNLRELSRQNFQNGRWNVYTIGLTGGSLAWRHFAPLGFVVALFGSGVLAIESSVFGWVFSAISVVYIVGAITAALASPRGRHAGSRALVPLVFLVLHLSYGLGSLWGILTVTKALRNGH
jgi:glycosyltransferase involved in cell wall biosynthesis